MFQILRVADSREFGRWPRFQMKHLINYVMMDHTVVLPRSLEAPTVSDVARNSRYLGTDCPWAWCIYMARIATIPLSLWSRGIPNGEFSRPHGPGHYGGWAPWATAAAFLQSPPEGHSGHVKWNQALQKSLEAFALIYTGSHPPIVRVFFWSTEPFH